MCKNLNNCVRTCLRTDCSSLLFANPYLYSCIVLRFVKHKLSSYTLDRELTVFKYLWPWRELGEQSARQPFCILLISSSPLTSTKEEDGTQTNHVHAQRTAQRPRATRKYRSPIFRLHRYFL